MRSFSMLLGVMAMVSFGCGTTVTYLGGDDDDGEGGGGVGGAGGTGGSTSIVGPGPATGTVTSTGTGPVPPTNPPECPLTPPVGYIPCDQEDLQCGYLENEGCIVDYLCVVEDGCYGGTGGYDGGYGGYGGCDPYSYWVPTDATCSPSAVPCASAQQGDVCALPGDWCEGDYTECGYTDKYCGEDHRWDVEEWDDECCYDECCYGECECDPYYCPPELPIPGDFCDPCFDSEYCSYEIPNDCGGSTYAYASCNWETYSWDVEYSGDDCGEGGWGTSTAEGTGGYYGGGGYGGF
jgi:hypothetical protein